MVGRIQVIEPPDKPPPKPSVGVRVTGGRVTPRAAPRPRPEDASLRIKVEGKPVTERKGKGFIGRAFERFGKGKETLKGLQEEGKLVAGTVPIGPAAAGQAGAALKNLFSARKASRAEKAARTLAAQTGNSVESIRRRILESATNRRVQDLARPLIGGKTAVVAGAFSVAGLQAISAWYAMDNVITTEMMAMRTLIDNIKFGQPGALNSTEAIIQAEQIEEDIDFAISHVRITSFVNPVFWIPGRSFLPLMDRQRDNLIILRTELDALLDPEATAAREEQQAASERRSEVLNIRREQDLTREPADVGRIGENI